MSDFLKYVGGTAGAVTIGAVTATAAAWYMMSRTGPPPVFMIDRNCQSREVPVSGRVIIASRNRLAPDRRQSIS